MKTISRKVLPRTKTGLLRMRTSDKDFMGKHTLYLYLDTPDPELKPELLVSYLNSIGISPRLKGDFFKSTGASLEEFARGIAKTRIIRIEREGDLNESPSNDDVSKELKILKTGVSKKLEKDLSNIYEAFAFTRILKDLVKKGLHIIYTSRMLATFQGARYHGRTIVMDFPVAVISTTGIVEAPAKPREYYIKIAAYTRAFDSGLISSDELDTFQTSLESELEGSFVAYGDKRLTEIVKGYTLQALFYLVSGEAFCADRDCRLYNAHTQEDLIHSQLGIGGLCKNHKPLLEQIRQKVF